MELNKRKVIRRDHERFKWEGPGGVSRENGKKTSEMVLDGNADFPRGVSRENGKWDAADAVKFDIRCEEESQERMERKSGTSTLTSLGSGTRGVSRENGKDILHTRM